MKQFFAPLTTFVFGMIFLAGLTLFFPAIQTSTNALAANTSGVTWAWGWTWLMTNGVVRLLMFIIGFFGVVIATGMVWLFGKKR